jgi:hypothetical protein
MDLNSRYQHQFQQNEPNSRLLRFRSATSSDHIRSNFKQGGEGCTDTDSEPAERLVLRFNNSGETSSGSFRQFMDHNPSNHSSSNASSSMMVGSSMGMDQPNRTTSPAGHFSNNIISFQNGIVVLVLFLLFLTNFFDFLFLLYNFLGHFSMFFLPVPTFS